MRRNFNTFDAFKTLKDVNDCKNFREAIVMYCDINRITLKEMSEMMGYSYMHFMSTIAGRYDITLRFAKKLGKIMELDPLDLIRKYMETYEEGEQ